MRRIGQQTFTRDPDIVAVVRLEHAPGSQLVGAMRGRHREIVHVECRGIEGDIEPRHGLKRADAIAIRPYEACWELADGVDGEDSELLLFSVNILSRL